MIFMTSQQSLSLCNTCLLVSIHLSLAQQCPASGFRPVFAQRSGLGIILSSSSHVTQSLQFPVSSRFFMRNLKTKHDDMTIKQTCVDMTKCIMNKFIDQLTQQHQKILTQKTKISLLSVIKRSSSIVRRKMKAKNRQEAEQKCHMSWLSQKSRYPQGIFKFLENKKCHIQSLS